MGFLERMGIEPEKSIQIRSMDDRLRNRLYNCLQDFFNSIVNAGLGYGYKSTIKFVFDQKGLKNQEDIYRFSLDKYFNDISYWYTTYEIIEYCGDFISRYHMNSNQREYMRAFFNEFNRVLEEEKSGYRFLNGQIVPITDEKEMASLRESTNTGYSNVNIHMGKALSLYADRDKPDYENSIKESMSAVEAMCRIITKDDKTKTLGEAINKLEDNGIEIHGAFKKAMSSLYGYASNEDGIRHGGIDYTKLSEEDAKYMLIVCSAFINYLIEKLTKIKQ